MIQPEADSDHFPDDDDDDGDDDDWDRFLSFSLKSQNKDKNREKVVDFKFRVSIEPSATLGSFSLFSPLK